MPTLNLEQKRALNHLKSHPLIEYIKHDYYKITAIFSTGIREHWVMRDRPRGNPRYFSLEMPQTKLFTKYGLPIYSEFETNPLDEEELEFLKPFFIIQRKDIDRAGFLDIRLGIHGLILKLTNEGWIDLKYPKSILAADLRRLKCCDENRFFSAPGTVSAFLKYGHPHLNTEGRTLVEHFLNWGNEGHKPLRDAWSSPSSLHSAITELLGTRKDITRSNIVGYLSIAGGRRHSGPKFINPGLYYSIIKNFFNRHKTIYDTEPGYGSKLLAASMLEAEYVADCDMIEMADFVGCSFGIPKERYDLIIIGDNQPLLAEEALQQLDKYLRIAIGVLILVHKDAMEEVKSKHPPRRILKAQMCPNFLLKQLGHHYFFIY